MTIEAKPAPDQIRRARANNPKMRERELARILGVSEGEFVAAFTGVSAVRLEPRVDDLLNGLGACGEVMALTRNESAVHEKIGVYDNVVTGPGSAMVLSSEIDLRIFPKAWAFGFAVEKRDEDGTMRHSLQFFDATGEAVHKVHARPATDRDAFRRLGESLASADQSPVIDVTAPAARDQQSETVDHAGLRERWAAMTDTHQFHGLLRSLKLRRLTAVSQVGDDYAQQLDASALEAMMRHAAQDALPIMCFVGSAGCIQIHSGPISAIKTMGPWINVMDPTFHLHLRGDHVAELWAVRKPTKDGHVTSLEAYDAQGEMIIQFFGKRKEGQDERTEWRFLMDHLPRVPQSTAA
jgi:putative hemin transport protein